MTTMVRETAAVETAATAAVETAAVDVPEDRTGEGPTQRAGEIRRHELAAFLRHRREHLSPEQVGLPRGRRRRTPGLRREEIAQLSAVGVTWYTWLEQARDIKVSAQVLDALARALLLDASERAHLFQLAGATDPAPGASCPSVTAAQRALLEQLEPIPACIQNSRYDILAYNRTYGLLLCDLETVPPADRNCLVLCFTNADWRASLHDPEEVMRVMAAKFRGSMAGHLGEPAWKLLLKRLMAESAEFRAVWERHEVVGSRGRRKQFRNAHVGLVAVDHTDLWLGPHQGPRMVTYPPADDESRGKLEKLQAIALERGVPPGR
ncbi:helix-turn-helix domain-containing protein [Streptomyces sp. RY43-2]|uniref:Helix-turn-helix domain-containing protein n=1 Tax=Streptomyces macrolidinus TaxID=2952607 RepID=A0ABT0Z728_9ACTN|nr:helix-turn-helix domain-containing protein [Streptomyces macrolidinus]MCN9239575.1 helix-turn-helix domain-containing protein [Streptomyces macrolidinus]